MDTFLGCRYNSQDVAQTPENFARSYKSEAVIFRNSVTDYFPPTVGERSCQNLVILPGYPNHNRVDLEI